MRMSRNLQINAVRFRFFQVVRLMVEHDNRFRAISSNEYFRKVFSVGIHAVIAQAGAVL